MTVDDDAQFLFVRNAGLRKVLVDRYQELQRIRNQNCPLSQVFLAGSIIEGIFLDLAQLHESRIRNCTGFQAITKRQDNLGRNQIEVFKRLRTEDIYNCLQEIGIIRLVGLAGVYEFLREHRNCIHPMKQHKSQIHVDQGKADIANGVLRSTLDYVAKYRFFDGHTRFIAVTGLPCLSEDGTLTLPPFVTDPPHTNSFVILESPVIRKCIFRAEVDVPRGGIVNFVFNFSDGESYMFVRLDSRPNPDSGLGKYDTGGPNLTMLARDDPAHFEAYSHAVPVDLQIDVDQKFFTFSADNKRHSYLFDREATENIYDRFKPGTKIGMFSELHPVTIRIKHIEVA